MLRATSSSVATPYYRVDRIDTVKDGPDAGKRDVLTTTQVQRVYKSVWEPVR